MAETPPVDEKGYVISNTGWRSSWWPDLDVVESIPELRYPENLTTFEEMQIDPQVSSTVSAVTLPLRSTGWWVDPNGADADVVEAVVAQLGIGVRGIDRPTPIRTRDRFSFTDHLDLALDSLPMGHSVFEQVARVDESGFAHLRKLAWRPPRTISKWNIARDGGLESIEQRELKAAIPVDRLVVYSHRRRGGAWSGRSILRTAWKFWILKERMLRIQAIGVDRTGVGTPVYEQPPIPDHLIDDPERAEAFAEAQRKAGLQIATQYRGGEDSGASIPNGAKLSVIGVSGNLPDPDKVIRYYDEQIGKSVLANFLSLGGENSRGSYALGSTFADFFIQSLQAEAKWLCDVLTQHVVEDFVDWNWGPDTRAPRIVCDDIGSKHPVTADAIAALVNSGVLQPDPGLEQFMRSTYGITQRDTEWGKGDLDKAKTRADIFRQLRDAGASFDTAKAAAGLPNLTPDQEGQQ